MKRHFIILIAFFYLVSCSDNSDKTMKQQNINSDTLSIADQEAQSNSDYTSENDYELNYVVKVADGYDYDSLRTIALATSEYLKFKFDTLDRYYNPLRKKIVLPDNYADDIWSGEYYFRRYGDSIVSIEMSVAYIDTLTDKNENAKKTFYSDTLKMFVFANMFTDKKKADSLLKILKPKFKRATIIPTEIYMGCMH